MIETFTRLQCIELQREIEALPRAERKARAGELGAIQRRLIALRAERRAQPQPAPKPKPPKPEPLPPAAAGPEVIVLRRPARPPSRPPEAVQPILREPRQPQPFTDLRAGIAEATRRHR